MVCMLREGGHKGALTNPAVGEGWLCVSHHYRCKIGQACFQPLWQVHMLVKLWSHCFQAGMVEIHRHSETAIKMGHH